jgi:hypothetical protein
MLRHEHGRKASGRYLTKSSIAMARLVAMGGVASQTETPPGRQSQ